MFQLNAKRAETAINLNRLDLVEPSRTIPYTHHRAHSLWKIYFSSYADNQFALFRPIPLASGGTVIVDAADYDDLAQFSWYLHQGKYARRSIRIRKGVVRGELMHRRIMRARPGVKIDHANMDGLDNRRENLRVCTSSQNNANKVAPSHRPMTSKYRGVCKHKKCSGWVAQITYNKRVYSLGSYVSEEAAAMAYDLAAVAAFGEFARLNFAADGSL